MKHRIACIGFAFALTLVPVSPLAADEPKKLIVFNDNGAWCWYQDPRVVHEIFRGVTPDGGRTWTWTARIGHREVPQRNSG